jgi:CheY-like chemotaxis protein
LPLLFSDPSEFREVLTNLVFNAVDALVQGGTITFVTRSIIIPDPENEGAIQRRLQVEVKDNGVGMDEKIRQRCLEPFFSTKSLRGGTGLGLAMVYGMVQRHEGSIEIESSPGHGTCVRLTFPIQAKPPQAVHDTPPRAEKKHALNVLCIDDEEPIRVLLEDCLTHFNHRVITAASGEQGIKLFRMAHQDKQPFEVVITDFGMPKMDGHHVARTIKAEFPHTPIIMMTGWGTLIKENNKIVPEVDAMVSKPPCMQELNELLLRITKL